MGVKNNITIEEPQSICDECGGLIITDLVRGERVCSACGLVVEDNIIDEGPDYRKFKDDAELGKNRDHYGSASNVMLHDKGLSTDISPRNRDASGRALPSNTRAIMYRLRKIHHQSRMNNAYERSFVTASSTISKICQNLYLPKIYGERAAIIYRKALVNNLIRGRSITGVAAACVYAACRIDKNPRTLDELADAAMVGRKEVGRTYRFVVKRLRLKIMPSAPEEYVPRFCSDLGLSFDTQNYAMDILSICNEKELLTGRGPIGIAASAIYIAAIVNEDGGDVEEDDHITQKKIADVTGITEVTIRNRYKEIVKELNIEEFKEKCRSSMRYEDHQ